MTAHAPERRTHVRPMVDHLRAAARSRYADEQSLLSVQMGEDAEEARAVAHLLAVIADTIERTHGHAEPGPVADQIRGSATAMAAVDLADAILTPGPQARGLLEHALDGISARRASEKTLAALDAEVTWWQDRRAGEPS